jgi:hypothetical protein
MLRLGTFLTKRKLCRPAAEVVPPVVVRRTVHTIHSAYYDYYIHIQLITE